jgi:hypothetical protein
MSKQLLNSVKLARLRRWLIALAVVVSVGLASSPAQAASLNGSHAHIAASPARGSASIRITDVEYNSVLDNYRGMLVHIYLDVVGLQGTPVRVAVFFNWDDDTTLYADPNAPTDFVTTSGALTAQYVVTPSYNDTYWKDFKLFVPYVAFPSVSSSQGAYLYPAVGIDGQDFAVYGDNVNFTLNP